MKKFLGVLVALVIVVAGVGGVAYYNGYLDLDSLLSGGTDVLESDFDYELVEAEKSTLAYTIYPDTTSEKGMFDPFTKYGEILKETDAAYLWENEIVPGDGDWFEYHVDSVSKEEFERRMKNSKMSEEDINFLNPSFDADKLKALAGGIIQGITKPSKSVINKELDYEVYPIYNGSSEIECFNNINIGSEGEKVFFSNEKLSLKCTNVKVGTLMGEDFSPGYYVAKVSADVTCKKNQGAFKDTTWIPAEGETKRIEFLVEFTEDNHMLHVATIHNIRAIS